MSRRQKLVEFLGLRRNTSLLLVALVLVGTGEKLWLGFAPKYFETLGALSMIWFWWFIYRNAPGGRYNDGSLRS